MTPADLHRVDTRLLADDRAIVVPGEVEQHVRPRLPGPRMAHVRPARTRASVAPRVPRAMTPAAPAADDEAINDALFNVRVGGLLALYLAALLLAVGMAVPWVAALVRQGLAP